MQPTSLRFSLPSPIFPIFHSATTFRYAAISLTPTPSLSLLGYPSFRAFSFSPSLPQRSGKLTEPQQNDAAAAAGDGIDPDASEEERALIEEVAKLKASLADARQQAADTDFVKMTENIPELGRLKFKARRQLRGHLAKVTDLAWGKEPQLMVTASQDGKLMIWNPMTENKLTAITLKTAWVLTCSFAPSDSVIASGGLDNTCSIYSYNRAENVVKPNCRELAGHDGYIACARFPNENQLLTCSGDKTCALWDLEKAKITQRFKGHDNDVNAVALAEPNRQIFVSVSSDHLCKLWDLREDGTKACQQTFEGHEQDVNGVDFFPQSEYAFVTSSDDGSCRMWDIRADQMIGHYIDDFIQSGTTSVAVSRSGRLMIAGYDDFNCHVWDLLREERVGIMNAHYGRVSCVNISPDGLGIATGSWDTTCLIWTAK